MKSFKCKGKHPIRDGSVALLAFCDLFGRIVMHNFLERSGIFGSKRTLWEYFQATLEGQEGLTEVLKLTHLTTPVGQARALIRWCLNRKTLAEYIQVC